MGDKSPKAKQRDQSQKNAAKTQSKSVHDKRQAAFASASTKEKKK